MLSFSKLLLLGFISAVSGLASANPAQAATPSSSITYEFAYEGLYIPELTGGSGLWIDKNLFQIEAPANTAFTGQMSATLTASYEVDPAAAGSAYINLVFDVLLPRCDQCGMFDSDLVGTGHFGNLDDDGTNFVYTTDSSVASGLYSRLLIYQIIVGQMPAYSGHIQFQSIIFSAETVALGAMPSTVPELPPALLLTLGLAVLGVAARSRSGQQLDSQAATRREPSSSTDCRHAS